MKKKQKQAGIPEQFWNRLATMYDSLTVKQIASAFALTRPTTFRTNTLKNTSEQLQTQLQTQGFEVEPVPTITDAFILKNKSLRELTDTEEYKSGQLYVQSLSSMLPALVLAPQPGEHILDLCAAPGSKTTQMAALTHNTGEIIANDNSHIRLYKLKANLAMQGVTNTTVTNLHGQILWQQHPQYFDRTLVDVPCSMEGRFDSTDPKSYQFWSTKKVKELAERQRFLLKSAISATKVGGTIVYSTCTLSPEENEGVIDWVMKKMPSVAVIEEITLSHLPLQPGISEWGEKKYTPEMAKSARILPSAVMEGFFIAKLRKIASNVKKSDN